MEAEKPSYAVYGNVCACGRLPDGREEGEAPVSISAHPRQCPSSPLPHNLTNIKSRHGTKTPPISSAVRAPLSAHFILQGFLLFLSFVPLFLSGWLMAPTRSTVIDWHWLGWRWIIPRNAPDRYPSPATLANPYIETAQAQVAHFVCRTQRPRDWLLLLFEDAKN